MLGDICHTCSEPIASCACECEDPCLPGDNGACETWLPMACVFWMGDPIAGTPIKKGTPLTEVVFYLLDRINTIEAQLP